jgi:lipopolysaccharide export system ATP-binding protein
MSASKLIAKNLRKSYGATQIIKDVSIAITRGEVVGLLGANGAGKTTCFYMICGLVPADSGVILLENNDITPLPLYMRARLGIGYLPQEASVFRHLSVEDNIMAILEIAQQNPAQSNAKLNQLLDEFKIRHIRKSKGASLSGGERRRVEIARALASDPKFIFLDEPFAGVDPIAVADIQNLITQLKNRGLGVLITDHNVRETLGIVERAYILHDGEILVAGSPQQIVRSEQARKVYLGDSFTQNN